MADIILDGDFSTATIAGALLLDAPIPGDATKYVATQDYVQRLDLYTPLAMNTAHSTLSGFTLQGETKPNHVGGGIGMFTRTYAKLPTSYYEPSTFTYNFIGFWGVFGPTETTATGRQRFQKKVACRIKKDFFLVGAGSIYTDLTDIPLIYAQKYYFGTDPNLATDYLGDAPPLSSASNPSRTAYEAMITAGDEIAADDSSIDRWMGNIIVRSTPYVVAI